MKVTNEKRRGREVSDKQLTTCSSSFLLSLLSLFSSPFSLLPSSLSSLLSPFSLSLVSFFSLLPSPFFLLLPSPFFSCSLHCRHSLLFHLLSTYPVYCSQLTREQPVGLSLLGLKSAYCLQKGNSFLRPHRSVPRAPLTSQTMVIPEKGTTPPRGPLGQGKTNVAARPQSRRWCGGMVCDLRRRGRRGRRGTGLLLRLARVGRKCLSDSGCGRAFMSRWRRCCGTGCG